MTTDVYEAIVIGTGQGGAPLASTLAKAGKRTAVIERADVGGSCVNYGCTPTKTMVASARVAYLARRGADYGVRTGPVTVDMEVVRERKRAIVESFRGHVERNLTGVDGLDLLRGEARFTAPHDIDVALTGGGHRALSAPWIVINTGARTVRPDIPGLDEAPTLDNASIMELDHVPDHLLVLGGGYIGLEFGQMFRRLGSEVTVVHRGHQLLAREDADVAEEVARILTDDGIRILLDAHTTRARGREGDVQLSITCAGRDMTARGSALLLAVGRAPDTAALDPSAAGIAIDDRGYVTVDDRLQTTAAGVYAIGDVKPGPAFTHISYDDFRILRTNLLDGGGASTADRLVPYTVFIDPQLGRVGLTEAEARATGRNVRVAKMPMSRVARALEMDEARGFMKAIVDADTEVILGAAVLGIEGGELMAALQVAMMARLPFPALRDGVFAHPTLAESLNNLFGSFES